MFRSRTRGLGNKGDLLSRKVPIVCPGSWFHRSSKSEPWRLPEGHYT